MAGSHRNSCEKHREDLFSTTGIPWWWQWGQCALYIHRRALIQLAHLFIFFYIFYFLASPLGRFPRCQRPSHHDVRQRRTTTTKKKTPRTSKQPAPREDPYSEYRERERQQLQLQIHCVSPFFIILRISYLIFLFLFVHTHTQNLFLCFFVV